MNCNRNPEHVFNFDDQHFFVCALLQVLKLRGEVQYRKTLITNNGSPTGAGSPVGIAVDPARG